MLGILSKTPLPCLWFPRKRKGMLVIPGFYCFECCSECHSAIRSWSTGSRRNRLSASPGSDFHLSSFLWPPYLLLHFMHILPTLSSSSEMMQFCLRKQASFSNKPRYLLVAFLFISSDIGDSIFRLCLRAAHSVSTRGPRKMPRVILRDAKGSPRGQHERLSEVCAAKGSWFKNLSVTFTVLVSKPSVFQPLRGNEIFPPSTASLIHNSQI